MGSNDPRTILSVKDVQCRAGNPKAEPIFSHVSFDVNEGNIIVLQGKSGSGKTTLLKCLAHLNVYEGEILFHGKNPSSWGIPFYRTRVLYVPQRPSLLPGTPRDFLKTLSGFDSRRRSEQSKPGRNGVTSSDTERPFEVARAWGIDNELWDRDWSNLSGGEAQRVALAVGVGLDAADVLLLDEPTSALDPASSKVVEDTILEEIKDEGRMLRAIVWITHSEEQAHRVGTRFLRVTSEGIREEEDIGSNSV